MRTDVGVIQKHDITFAVLVSAVNDLGEGARINKKIEAQKLRTVKKRKERPKVLTDEMLQTAVSVPRQNNHVERSRVQWHARCV